MEAQALGKKLLSDGGNGPVERQGSRLCASTLGATERKSATSMRYWKDQKRFEDQTNLLEALFADQWRDYSPGGESHVSIETLGDRQRQRRIGCVYFAGGRIDSKFCLGTQNTGLLHSALPTDYPKAIRPGFHSDHAELILCTHGQVVVEYATDLSSAASITTVTLRPGDWLLVQRMWPHKISLSPLRGLLAGAQTTKEIPKAGFLAVKMGSLTGKSEDEDMGSWDSSTRTHGLITIWHEEKKSLLQLCENPGLCEQLSIDQAELRNAIGA